MNNIINSPVKYYKTHTDENIIHVEFLFYQDNLIKDQIESEYHISIADWDMTRTSNIPPHNAKIIINEKNFDTLRVALYHRGINCVDIRKT
jgi:hypothetical protein